MYSLRSFRGIARFLKRYPKFDRTWSPKGEHPRNVFINQRELKFSPFTTVVGSSNSVTCHLKTTFYDIHLNEPHKITFSTSKPTFSDDPLSQSDLKKAVDNLTDQFMETRDLLEDARETLGTVYFSDDMKDASDSVKKTLKEYQELLSKLSDTQKRDVIRTIGLKMKELEAQQQALEQESL